jgi:hypothetical protein
LMESQYFLVMPTVVDREWSVKLRYESDWFESRTEKA